jgi:hypothetical protein
MRIVIGYKDGKPIYSANEPMAVVRDTRNPHYIRPISGPQRVGTTQGLPGEKRTLDR